MALSPGIPTSFVPKQPVQVKRPMSSGTNVFLGVTLVIAGIVIALAVGVFLYGKYLDRALAGKEAQLAQAQSQVDENTVQDFVRLRDRLVASKTLLSQHIVLSKFFDRLESLTLQNVRFTGLTMTVASDNTAELQMAGTAKSFNALAAQSNAFAGEKGIKRAIFSDITVTKDNQVSFKMTGDVDSSLILEGNTPLKNSKAAASAPAAITVPVKTIGASSSSSTPTQ